MLRVTRSPPELGLLDGAEGVDDGGLGDSAHQGRFAPVRRSRAGFPTRGASISYPWPGPRAKGRPTLAAGAAPDGRASRAVRAKSARQPHRWCEISQRFGPEPTPTRAFDTPYGRPYRSTPTRSPTWGGRTCAGREPRSRPRPSPIRTAGAARHPCMTSTSVSSRSSKAFGDVSPSTTSTSRSSTASSSASSARPGCGKTTTLRMIGGFEQPTSGLIELQGQDVTWLPPYKRQRQHGLPELRPVPAPHDLRERRLRPAPQEGQGRRGQAAASPTCSSSSSCRASSSRKPNQISGGQAQRVALARALINRPAVLLLDEPLGALDLKLRKQMQVELKRIQQEVGITFIYVTHDQEEAMTMSRSHRRHEPGPLRAARRPRGALRAADDAVRRGLPRRQQPARAATCRGRRPTATRSSSSADGTVVRVPAAARRRPHDGRRRRPPGEDPAPRGRHATRRTGTTACRAS